MCIKKQLIVLFSSPAHACSKHIQKLKIASWTDLSWALCYWQDMRYGAAYSPMGASSPALAQALASQTSEYSAKNAAARTTSRLRNVSVRVPKIPG